MCIAVGITGGIGSGKSTIARVFQILGIPLYNADMEAKKLVVSDTILKSSIIELLGSEAYTSDGAYNTRFVSNLVFTNKSLLDHLNALIHPVLALHFNAWLSAQKAPYILKEAALLIESGSYKQLDYLLVVTAPEYIRVSRIAKRDSRTPDEIAAIFKNQISDEVRLAEADFIIKNDGLSLVLPQVLAIDHRLRNR